jgi:hypothetical protein
MTPKSTFWAALAVSAVLAGQVAVAETNTPANETTDAVGTYVDPMVKNRQRCLERPGLPQWMMEHPLGFEWRLDLCVWCLRTKRIIGHDLSVSYASGEGRLFG